MTAFILIFYFRVDRFYVSSSLRPTGSEFAAQLKNCISTWGKWTIVQTIAMCIAHHPCIILSIMGYPRLLFIQMDPTDPLLPLLVSLFTNSVVRTKILFFFLIANIYYVHDITSYLHITVRLSTSIARYAKSFSGGEGML